MVRHRVLIPVVIALIACACAWSSHTTPALVHTSGVIVRVGGPAPGSPQPLPDARFRLIGAGRSASVRADGHGRFAVDLPRGTYRVEITGHAPQAGAGFLPAVPHVIHVRPSGGPLRLVVNIR